MKLLRNLGRLSIVLVWATLMQSSVVGHIASGVLLIISIVGLITYFKELHRFLKLE
jgi:hypothetical protein